MIRFWQIAMGILVAFIFICGSSNTLLGNKTKQGSTANSSQKAEKALLVKAVQVKKADGERHLDYPGIVLTDNQSELSFRVSGMIEDIPVKVGQVLKKGQLIATLDNNHYSNAREQARAAQRQARARMQDAQNEYQRLKKLKSARDISERKLQNAQTEAKTAEENYHIAQKRLAEVQRQLGYTSLKAPFDGIIASRKVHSFQTIEAGQPVVLMVDSSELHFQVQLPTSLFPIRNDFQKFECVFPALDGLKLPAKLHGMGPSALPPLRTFPLTVELESSAKHPIMPGTQGILHITAAQDASKSHILVPASAITSDHKGSPHVWIADPKSSQAHQRAVKLGGLHDGKMAVESGISPGEWVITAGQGHLSPGIKIKIVKPVSGSH
ncbi:MAG: efflux RND transporter periplasmic adaptor subunit [Desulfovibrionales bacterium]|nr:efflux RND transporter periplasmic adaptor subunit [Desulfovibrionales bacterium]